MYVDEFFFNEYTNKAMLNSLRSKRMQAVAVSEDAELNDKETQILKLMCDEKSTREIAEIISISPRTVEAIRERMKLKTGAKSLAGLILYAVKNKIV